MKFSILFVAGILLSTAAISRAVDVRLEDCPTAVQDTIRANTKGGRITEIEFQPASGRYQVDVDLSRQRDRDLTINASGVLLRIDEDVSLRQVPPQVRRAINKLRAGGGRIDDLDRETTGARVVFRVEIEFTGDRDLNALLAKNGRVLKRSFRD